MPPRPLEYIYPGLVAAQALYAAVDLGLPDQLAEGPRSAADLAAACGAHAPTLERLLRALTTLDIFQRLPDGRYRNAPQGELLRASHPQSLRAVARYLPAPYMLHALAQIPQSIRTGEPAFDRAFGQSFFAYLDSHPEAAADFNRVMTLETQWVVPNLVRTFDFSRFRHLVDVAGGQGTFLREILIAVPTLRGTLFDQPQVVARAEDLSALGARVSVAAGSFFNAVPSGGDLYSLRRILHDWSDDDARRILDRIRAVMPPEGRLLVIEGLIDSPTHPVGLGDLMMLVLGGRERTEADFHALFESAAFAHVRTVPVGNYALLEARPA